MAGFPLSAEGRAVVGNAVTAAEAGTDGEIVTIVTRRSDGYRDTALGGGILGMLLAVAVLALWPGWLDGATTPLDHGWGEAPTMAARLVALLVIEIAAFAIVAGALSLPGWRVALTPGGVKARRVRARAIRYFKVGTERRTAARVGVLLYLSLDERRAEIVADEAIHAKVPAERWGAAMAAMLDDVRAGRPAEGMAAAVAAIGAIIAEHFPKTADDENELPDRVIEL